MDTGCDKSELDDSNKTILNAEESAATDKVEVKSVFQSPTFKTANHKANRTYFSSRSGYSESSEYEIPSYQINQSVSSRTASKSENENDLVLPLSPVFSPLPRPSRRQHRASSIHTLGTIAKRCSLENFSRICGKVKSDEVSTSSESKKKCGSVFDNLQMNNKDISWVSSMASPTPARIPGSQFNTIERATFLPEEKFQKIQPRALFSPTSDDNSGCSPLPISSDSEEESYKANARLSDVCATLRELKFKSLEQESNTFDKNENPCQEPLSLSIETYHPSSPVFMIKPKKSVASRKKAIVVRSPETIYNYEFSFCKYADNKSLCEKIETEEENTVLDNKNDIGQDEELFLDISFTELDKMCSTLLDTKNKSDTLSEPQRIIDIFLKKKPKEVSLDLLQPKSLIEKHYYVSEIYSDVEHTGKYFSTYEEIPINLRNKQQNLELQSKINKMCNNRDLWKKFNLLYKNNPKELYSILMDKNCEISEKKLKKEKFETMYRNAFNKYLSENERSSNRRDGYCKVEMLEEEEKMLKAAEEVEKTLAEEAEMVKAVDVMENTVNPDLMEEFFSTKKSNDSFSGLEESLMSSDKKIGASLEQFQKGKLLKPDSVETLKPPSIDVTTSHLYNEPSKFNNVFDGIKTGFCFSTASGSKVSVSKESLEKAKEFMIKCEQEEKFESKVSHSPITSKVFSTKQEEAFETKDSSHSTDNFEIKFTTCLGQPVKVTNEALKKAKELMSSCDNNLEVSSANSMPFNVVNSEEPHAVSTSFSSKVPASKKSLAISKQTLSVCVQDEFSSNSNQNSLKLDSTNDGLEVKKVNDLMEMELKSSSNDKMSKVLSEPSGKFHCENSPNETKTDFNPYKFDSTKNFAFSTASGQKVSVSKNALNKAKAFLDDFDQDESLKNFCESDSIRSSTPKLDHSKSREKFGLKKFKNPSKNFGIGFATCSGKKIEVSSEALERGRNLMSNLIDDSKDSSENLGLQEKTTKSDKSDAAHSNARETESVKRKMNSPENGPENAVVESDKKSLTFPTPIFDLSTRDSTVIQRENKFSDDVPVEKIKKRKLFSRDENDSEIRKFSPPRKSASRGGGGGIKRSSEDTLSPRKRIKCTEMEEENSGSLKEKRSRRRLEQEKIIEEKKNVIPMTGSLLIKKSSGKRMNFAEAVENCHPENYGKDEGHVTFSNAVQFKFSGQDFQTGSDDFEGSVSIRLEDDFEVIPDEENNLGLEEFKRGFLAGPGVQPNLIPRGWFENHYKWTVWKLARYETAFPRHFRGIALTPNNLMLQLKYRYDREIDRSERSALKKILEKDDSSQKRMVLLVCGIRKIKIDHNMEYELNLIDGWYSCPARVDSAMAKLIEKEKVVVGMKLITQGAILVNCDQGISPLEITEDVHLKIFTNSTRRIGWDAKLGFQKNPGGITVSLDSAASDGGPISRVNVIVVRIYPLLYLEKMSDGRRIVRNLRAEEKADDEHKRILEQRIEKIYNEVKSETDEKSVEDPFSLDEEQGACSGSVQGSSDLSAQLKRRDRINKEISERVEEKLKKENLSRRDVSELFQAKVVDLRKPNFNSPTLLSIWSPSEEVTSLFSEGASIAIMNATVSHRSSPLMQINATRQTRFKKINRDCKYPERRLTSLRDVSGKMTPIFGEVDLVGIVFSVKKVSFSSKLSQIIYLTDAEFNFAGLSLWDSFKDYGWENILTPGSVVACSNLIWQGNRSSETEVPLLAVKKTCLFTENPRTDHLRRGLEELKENLPKEVNEFLSKCEEKLTERLEKVKKEGEIIKNLKVERTKYAKYHPEKSETKEIESRQTISADSSTASADATVTGSIADISNVEATETSFASKRLEKAQIAAKSSSSPFRWIPYKNV